MLKKAEIYTLEENGSIVAGGVYFLKVFREDVKDFRTS